MRFSIYYHIIATVVQSANSYIVYVHRTSPGRFSQTLLWLPELKYKNLANPISNLFLTLVEP